MATTSTPRTPGTPARTLRLGRVLRVAALTALLAGVSLLGRTAQAQGPATVHASAYVTTSMLAAALRPDSAGVAARALTRPSTQRLQIAGLGTLDVQSGPGEVIRVAPGVADARHQTTVIVWVFNVGS
jgi:hypothetical protein